MHKNARFWTWINDGWIRMTLQPGQEITHCVGGPHEEGYSYETTTYTHHGETVGREVFTESRDCDGRYDNAYSQAAAIDALDNVETPDRVMRPDWQTIDETQRPQNAPQGAFVVSRVARDPH